MLATSIPDNINHLRIQHDLLYHIIPHDWKERDTEIAWLDLTKILTKFLSQNICLGGIRELKKSVDATAVCQSTILYYHSTRVLYCAVQIIVCSMCYSCIVSLHKTIFIGVIKLVKAHPTAYLSCHKHC